MNDFVKVFDIADSGFRSIGFASTGFLFIGIGLIMFFSPQIFNNLNLQKTKEETKFQKFFRFFFLGFALLWTGASLFSTYGEYSNLRDANCQIAEGKVENFDPMPYGGHKSETYTVQNVNFGYSDYMVTSGFNNTASHGGPVNKDSVVRICYVSMGNLNKITKLEVKGYKGPVQDYSGGFGLFSQFKQLDKDMNGPDKPMAVARKYMIFYMLMLMVDFVLYILFIIPFFKIFFKVKVIEHEALEIDKKYLDQEKHTLENLTVKYDGEGVLWGRPYWKELMNSPGCALKMYLSEDKTKVVKSEIRMSTLMLIAFFFFPIVGVKFIGAVSNISDISKAPGAMRYFPYIVFPMIAINFWMFKGRFQKSLNQLLILKG